MVKILQNHGQFIVIIIFCMYWCVETGPTESALGQFFRRLLVGEITKPANITTKSINDSSILDDEARRSRPKRLLVVSQGKTKEHNGSRIRNPEAGNTILRHRSRHHHEKKYGNHSDHRGIKTTRGENMEKDKKIMLRAKQHHTEATGQPFSKNPEPKTEVFRSNLRGPQQLPTAARDQKHTKTHSRDLLRTLWKDSSNEYTTGGTLKSQAESLVTTARATWSNRQANKVTVHKYQLHILNTIYSRITKMLHVYQLQDDPPEATEKPPHTQGPGKDDSPPNEYLNPYAVDKQMKRLVDALKNDANITMEVIGRTVEYKNIILLKIRERDPEKYFRANNKYADEVAEKKIIFIVHGLTVMGMDDLITHEYDLTTIVKYYIAHLSKFDIFLIPIANPDGFSTVLNYHGNFWNKNLSPQSECAGVALDRNFDVQWNASHTISACSHAYPGPSPFSEAETKAVRDVFHLNSHKIIAYIHVHASTYDSKIFKGDAILYPRGYTEVTADDDKYIDMKGEVEEAMKNASFKAISVTVDTLNHWYGTVLGTSVDYASTVYGIPYAMEFAMQIYNGIQHEALTEIWGRIIDVVFKNIWKGVNSNPNDVKKK